MSYHYRMYREEAEKEESRYTKRELENMGTFQLRGICTKEKIMTASVALEPQRLSREDLIELLFRYRGRQEQTFRDDFTEESIQIVEKIVEKISFLPSKIEVPYKITVVKNMPLLASNEVTILHKFEGEYFCGILLDTKGQIQAVFDVVGQCLTLSPKRRTVEWKEGLYYDWQFLLLDGPSSQKMVQAYQDQIWSIPLQRSMVAVKTKIPIFAVEEAPVSEQALFIDFGTNNTCAAIVDEEGKAKWVTFQEGQVLCPTCATVKSCAGEDVQFVFGWEALERIKKDGYGSNVTFFHNLKKFLFEEETIEMQDARGNAASISSDVLLEEYLNYIRNVASAVFGMDFLNIRVLLPEKRAQFALERLKSIWKGQQVEAAESESLNSVYQEIGDGLGEMEVGNRQQVLVLHCGGGGMSLMDCSYCVKDTGVTYEVQLEEQYLNGDSGFGGNNLTYMILQYLKIRLFCKITNRKKELLGERFEEAYEWVDEEGTTDSIYEEFQELYKEAESILPTQFEELDEYGQYKKQNFFRLWFLAEQIKIRFASESTKSCLRLPKEFEEYCCVNIVVEGRMQEYPLEMEIHRDEVWSVIAPEIYRRVKNFLEPYCNASGILQGYRIKFSGLSCNIPVFRDAIREFTVGRRARLGKGRDQVLKLRAMEGAVKQEDLLKSGRMIPDIKRVAPAVSYTVVTQTHDGGSLKMIADVSWEEVVFGFVTRHVSTKEVEFQVCDTAEQIVRKRIVYLNRQAFKQTDYEQLFQKFPPLRSVQGELDSIGEKEIRLFVFREEHWDFCVLPLCREKGQLYQDKVNRFLFDDSSEDFFCGTY